jgi:pSer/pThr/pTyr-binding forkhead associated (FHA) protein
MAERIRNLNALVEELARSSPSIRDAMRAHLGIDAPIDGHETMPMSLRVTVKGITPEATGVLENRPVTVERFPFRIGRRTAADDPFTANELAIPDTSPWWVSRNHCMLSQVGDRLYLIDRGSRLGTFVDGKMVGGSLQTGRLELPKGEHEVRLGGALTPFRFTLRIGEPTKGTRGRRGQARRSARRRSEP